MIDTQSLSLKPIVLNIYFDSAITASTDIVDIVDGIFQKDLPRYNGHIT